MSDYKQQTNEAFFENSIKNSPFNSYPPHLTKDVEAFFEKHINLNWDNLFVTEKKEDFQLEEDFKKTKLSQLIDSYDSYCKKFLISQTDALLDKTFSDFLLWQKQ